MLPGIFETSIFHGKNGNLPVTASKFIRAMHPKAEVPPTTAAVQKLIKLGWWGQKKIHGHRAQLHIPADPERDIHVFNRQGQLHRKLLPPVLVTELRRLFQPKTGWTVVDAEWLKGIDHLFLFDVLKRDDVVLDDWSYAERFALLPRVYASKYVETLPVLKTVEACLAVLADPAPEVEGLVFKAPETRGFVDTAIVRCRKGA